MLLTLTVFTLLIELQMIFYILMKSNIIICHLNIILLTAVCFIKMSSY